MSIEALLTILILLIIGIIVIKAIRKLLSLCLLLVLLYFSYYTFFTYNGAVKLSILVETADIKSYRIDNKIDKDGTVIYEKPLKIGKYRVLETSCKTYKPVILCESKVEENKNGKTSKVS